MSDETEKLNPGDDAPEGTPSTGEDICPDCHGTGKIGQNDCKRCGGTGRVIEGIGGGEPRLPPHRRRSGSVSRRAFSARWVNKRRSAQPACMMLSATRAALVKRERWLVTGAGWLWHRRQRMMVEFAVLSAKARAAA